MWLPRTMKIFDSLSLRSRVNQLDFEGKFLPLLQCSRWAKHVSIFFYNFVTLIYILYPIVYSLFLQKSFLFDWRKKIVPGRRVFYHWTNNAGLYEIPSSKILQQISVSTTYFNLKVEVFVTIMQFICSF